MNRKRSFPTLHRMMSTLIVLLLAACGTTTTVPTLTVAATATPSAAETETRMPDPRATNTLIPLPTRADTATPGPTSTPFPLPTLAESAAGELVFLRIAEAENRLWRLSMDAAGNPEADAEQIHLNHWPDGLGEIFPSPDKQKLLIEIAAEGPSYEMANLQTEQLTGGNLPRFHMFFGWHPDSLHLLVGSDFSGDGRKLLLVNHDGEGKAKLLAETKYQDEKYLMDAVASPDGQRIWYLVSDRSNGENQIWEVGSDGRGSRLLFHTDGPATLTWSPDGTKVVFWDQGFWATDADGANLRKLNDARYNYQFNGELPPVWSPDSRFLAYQMFGRKVEGQSMLNGSNIFLLDAESGETRSLLPDGSTGNLYPVWSPDGQKIAFLSNRAGKPDVWVVNCDGSNLRQITTTGDNLRVILWRGVK